MGNEFSWEEILRAAKVKGGKVARAAGEHLTAKASRIAMDKGLADRPMTLDQAMDQARQLWRDGKLDKEAFEALKGRITEAFANRRR